MRAKSHNGAPPRSPAGEVFSFIAVKQQQPFTRELSGLWTYRSFLNDPRPLYPTAPPPGQLILQEALLKLETPTSTTLQGRIEWQIGPDVVKYAGAREGDVWTFDLRGWMGPGVGDEPSSFGIAGTANPRPGITIWDQEYFYEGHLTRNWPNGINHVPALVAALSVESPIQNHRRARFPLSR